jgi:hypothetical protein
MEYTYAYSRLCWIFCEVLVCFVLHLAIIRIRFRICGTDRLNLGLHRITIAPFHNRE